jgi:predicted transcriptional regulator
MRPLMALVVLAVLGFGAPARAQDPPPDPHGQHAQQPEDRHQMMERCKEMMAHHAKMQKEMQAMDHRLDELVAQMNQADGDARVDAIAETVTELVDQRRRMREHMSQMHGRMLSHMMEHMHMGMQHGEGAMQCPMMQQMGGPPPQE